METESTLWKRKKVEDLIGVTTTTLYRMMSKGAFPRPVRIGLRAVRWREEDILAWLNSREHAGPSASAQYA